MHNAHTNRRRSLSDGAPWFRVPTPLLLKATVLFSNTKLLEIQERHESEIFATFTNLCQYYLICQPMCLTY